MQNHYQLPTIKYYQTPEFKRWFAKYYFSGYLIMGIIIPLLWLFIFQLTHILDMVIILSIQILCISQMFYIFIYCIDEIQYFIEQKL